MLLRHTCAVKRAVPVGTNGRKEKQQLYASVRSLFIPMPTRAEMENRFSPGTAYDVYFPATADIKTGDQLVWDGDIFNVRAVRSYKVPRIAHKHVLATREAF